jgi:hypothetical protein
LIDRSGDVGHHPCPKHLGFLLDLPPIESEIVDAVFQAGTSIRGDEGAEYYEEKNRQQQIEFVRKKAAQLGLQVTPAQCLKLSLKKFLARS